MAEELLYLVVVDAILDIVFAIERDNDILIGHGIHVGLHPSRSIFFILITLLVLL